MQKGTVKKILFVNNLYIDFFEDLEYNDICGRIGFSQIGTGKKGETFLL